MGELGFKSWVCENHFISYSCIFFNSSMLWGEVTSNSFDFQKIHFFYNFDRSSLFFDQSKLCLKILVNLCLVRLIELVFRSIDHCESNFFKNSVLIDSNYFFKTFSNFPLSLRLGKAPLKIFCRFLPYFCKVFLPQGR